ARLGCPPCGSPGDATVRPVPGRGCHPGPGSAGPRDTPDQFRPPAGEVPAPPGTTGAGRRVPPAWEAPLLPPADGQRAALTQARVMTTVDGSAPEAAARTAGLVARRALAAALAVVLPVATYFAAHHQPGHRPFDAGAVGLVIASAGALALRRRYPVAVLALVFGITLIYFVRGYADGPVWLPLIIAYYT